MRSNNKDRLWLLAVLFVFLWACNKKLEVQEFIKYVNENKDFNKSYEDDIFYVSSEYRPAELLALSELRSNLNEGSKAISKEVFEKEKGKFNNAVYFDVRIGLKNKENIITKYSTSPAVYTTLLSELTYNMNRDVFIIADKKDTIRAVTYNYSNTYGMSPDVRLLFAFPKEAIEAGHSNIELVYNDKVFGIRNEVRFLYKAEDLIKKLPAIKEIK